MANIPNYVCTRCGRSPGRDSLTVKRVMFTTMGEGPRTLRSRVIDWLCDTCLEADADWHREKASKRAC
jgi:hypothetical protein